mgnify:FL=1
MAKLFSRALVALLFTLPAFLYAAPRVVTLSPANTELAFAAGITPVGVSSYSNYPPEAKNIEEVSTWQGMNLERIVALKPRAMQKSFGGNYDRKLFAKLRKLRKAIADEENIPPYVVFNDATLIEMAEQSPLTAGEMLSVNGVGTRKLERFGKPFMALIRAHVDGDDE